MHVHYYIYNTIMLYINACLIAAGWPEQQASAAADADGSASAPQSSPSPISFDDWQLTEEQWEGISKEIAALGY